jgi:hypothetical protein
MSEGTSLRTRRIRRRGSPCRGRRRRNPPVFNTKHQPRLPGQVGNTGVKTSHASSPRADGMGELAGTPSPRPFAFIRAGRSSRVKHHRFFQPRRRRTHRTGRLLCSDESAVVDGQSTCCDLERHVDKLCARMRTLVVDFDLPLQLAYLWRTQLDMTRDARTPGRVTPIAIQLARQLSLTSKCAQTKPHPPRG